MDTLEIAEEEGEMKHLSAWEIHTKGLGQLVEQAVQANEVNRSDIVWRGPGGDAVICDHPGDLDNSEEYMEYTDSGTVEEYL